MKNSILLELKKAICNPLFCIYIVLGIVLTLFSSYSSWQTIQNNLIVYENSAIPLETVSFSLYCHWIGSDCYSLGYSMFFFLLPLLAVFSYGWSLGNEKRCGYIRNIILREGRRTYYLSKYAAAFLAGGLVITIPMIFNFFLTSWYTNLAVPDVAYLYFSMMHGSLGSEVFYSYPLLFTFGYLVLDFIFCGLIACSSISLSFVTNNRLVILTGPFFVCMLLDYFSDYISTVTGYEHELSIMMFLHPAPFPWPVDYRYVILIGVILILFSFGLYKLRGENRDVF